MDRYRGRGIERAGWDPEPRVPEPSGSRLVPGRRTLTEALPAAQTIDELIAVARAAGGGQLTGDVREALEEALGHSLADVRIHTSPDAAAAATQLDASAFAVGQDVFFAAGAHAPDSERGRALLAHEVAHTVQQRGAQRGSDPLVVDRPSSTHEREADRFAATFTGPARAPMASTVASAPPPRVAAGAIGRETISRSPASEPPAALPGPAPREAPPPPTASFSIQPARELVEPGEMTYRIPGAANPLRRDGKMVCTWTFELEPAAAAAHGVAPRQAFAASYQNPQPVMPWRWTIEGLHKVSCDLRWESSPFVAPSATRPPPPPAQHLELAVRVQTLATASSARFDQVARTDAYFDARLRDRAPPAAGSGVAAENPTAATERQARVQAQDSASASIAPGRQVIVRGQLTTRAEQATTPLALAVGPAAGQPGKLALVDFTPGQRRMDYGVAARTRELIAALERRNSYAPGLVEIDVPARPDLGVEAVHTTFETTGRSAISAWASGLGSAGLVGMVGGGVAALVGAPVAVPLLLIAGLIGGAASVASLSERLHDARPDPRGIAIDVLSVASAVLGAGGLAAARAGVSTVTLGGRTFTAIEMTGRLALAADGAAFALLASEGADEIRQIWAAPGRSETERLQDIAKVMARIAATGGLVVASAATAGRRASSC